MALPLLIYPAILGATYLAGRFNQPAGDEFDKTRLLLTAAAVGGAIAVAYKLTR